MSCFQALPVNFGVLKFRAEHNLISIWGFQSGPRARLDLRMFSRLNGEHRDHPFQELWFGLARLRATGATLVRPETCSFRGKCVATGFAVLWIWDRKAGTVATDASSDKAKLNPKVGILANKWFHRWRFFGYIYIDRIGFDQCRFDPGDLELNELVSLWSCSRSVVTTHPLNRVMSQLCWWVLWDTVSLI